MALTAGSRGGLPLVPALALVAVILFLLLGPGVAEAAPELVFHVGGPRGWRVPDAGTSYGWWAMNNRFHVGDHLYFKYANDSVLVVDREAFDACNATEPLATFADGATTFRLDHPGFFCFISGEPGHCEEGQRLIVRVMVHPAAGATSPAAAPGPASGPATSTQLGHGGSGGRRPWPSGWPGASSSAATVVTASVAFAVAAATVVLISLVLMLQ
ncbi:early nodulin-like protein 5 [Phragmites australis]|uniref:early nodulin-like protein 5 n=1 Tax=Phragmites australis TaxID=29695 RepID=UPI002D77C96A|nr:early nodulin-like protein 5 [Phragmites australis]